MLEKLENLDSSLCQSGRVIRQQVRDAIRAIQSQMEWHLSEPGRYATDSETGETICIICNDIVTYNVYNIPYGIIFLQEVN